MAKKRAGLQNTSSIETRSFTKGMVKDVNESLMGEGKYLHARNAVNNSVEGDLGVLGNERSNKFCVSAPYTVIGAIHISEDVWALFSTDDINSEIGIFDESECSYRTVVNDPCLNFRKTNPIIGEARSIYDCTTQLYWADDRNPDRVINIDNPPWIQIPDPDNPNEDCNVLIDTDQLDCERLRMARLTKMPCLRIEQGPNGGELLNGTYQAVIAYTENEQRVTDYSIPSNLVSLFDHRNVNGSIDIIIEDIDTTYDEFELVVIGFVNQQLVARRMGIYSTRQSRISIDRIDPAVNTTVPISFIPLDRPSYERSEAIYRNGDYLLRVAPSSKLSFNYQPLANQIQTEWVSVEYPADYYRKAGVNVGYMRDEVYAYYIRWVYNTLDKSESYHIPGRAPLPGETATVPSPAYGTGFFFEENNTATAGPATGTTPDGGTIVARGQMAYWQSSEIYPDDNPEVWGDLCGKPIRHHKMPDNQVDPHFNPANGRIRVLGVQFINIPFPEDNDGNPIPGIIGYEILRGSREGNKTVVAKGMINNMGSYEREDNGEIAYYQNYPYNDLREDPFLADDWVNGDDAAGSGSGNGNPLGGARYARDKFTFHGPDTQFKRPFLSAKELKVFETMYGTPRGTFVEPYLHPKHKVITDFNFILGALVGFGIALKAVRGEIKTSIQSASVNDYPRATDFAGVIPGAVATTGAGAGYALDQVFNTAAITAAAASTGTFTANNTSESIGTNDFAAILGGTTGSLQPTHIAAYAGTLAGGPIPGVDGFVSIEYPTTGGAGLPGALRILQGIPTFLAYWGEGTDTFLALIKAFSKFHQYATAYQSHCFFNNHNFARANTRAGITNASYISDRIQEFGGITANNLYRGSCVGLDLNANIPDSTVQDVSRVLMSQVFGNTDEENLGIEFNTGFAAAHYAGLKQRLRNQYGQVDGVIQIPTSSCYQEYVIDPTNPSGATSEVIFGGDIYIGRYTEKNTFFYFFDWMYDLPNDFEYDYRLRKMLPYPTYWMDTQDFQLNDFFTGLLSLFSGSPSGVVPSGFHNFDRGAFSSGTGLLPNFDFNLNLIVKNAFMYLFNSGVRDFFVESEVNIEYRDWGDTEDERHYDPYGHTSLEDLFRTDIIKSGNFFKYDYSLSASRYYQGYPSWASMQFRNYDPEIAETCYTYYPKRIIYSLPQDKELRSDSWLVYLINNYKDFSSRVTAIKAVAKNGAMMLFENEAPLQFIGVDTLETDAGTKITLGDGGLFNQALQNIVNTDEPYEYGSCQSRLSVTNTPAGLFWISQNQGKIFNYGQGLNEISQQGLKWWFSTFLPYQILEDFPDFELLDNTIIGVGCQTIYDNTDGVVYFTKRDFKLRPEFEGRVTYRGEDNFQIGAARFKLGDPRYFDNASWTVSYDPKSQAWISFHDWHPNLMLPSINHFMTIKNAGIWKHNDRLDSFCNFYGDDYPFEVELVIPTGQTINTLKSVEYLMEVYQWAENEVDRHHTLDFNFDRAVVYNTEQVSGLLNLNLTPKNNAPAIVTYPQVNPTSVDILYSKEEHKYRFNQFWDITDDRGEFSNARRVIWNTGPSGYIRTLNQNNLDYQKVQTQRKRMRHYQANLWLQRRISGPHNMQLKLVNSKNQYSAR